MDIRRIAASKVILPDGKEYANHVVELLGSRLVNHYPLQGEIAMTEWLGGTIRFEEAGVFHITHLSDGTQRRRLLSPQPH